MNFTTAARRKFLWSSFVLLFVFSISPCKKTNPVKQNSIASNIAGSSCIAPYVNNQNFYWETAIRNGIVHEDSIVIAHETYLVIYKSNDTLYILQNADTINRFDYMSPQFHFSDFNNDGYADIIVDYQSNTPGVQSLLLFDSITSTYYNVKDFGYFPASESISGTSLYYSYHRSGCSDMNWDSDLFKIENDSAISLGRISGQGCENIGTEMGIYIYKASSDTEILFTTRPITAIDSSEDYKWGFIKEYWSKNYRRFTE